MSFYVAMQNRITYGACTATSSMSGGENRFVLVSRTSGYTQFLTIADAGLSAGDESEAPNYIKPGNVVVGTLISSDSTTGQETFSLNQIVPEKATFLGNFLPAEGLAIVIRHDHTLRVTARGRHAHIKHLDNGELQLKDESVTSLLGGNAHNWHYDASYLPWVSEILPSDWTVEDLISG